MQVPLKVLIFLNMAGSLLQSAGLEVWWVDWVHSFSESMLREHCGWTLHKDYHDDKR